MFGLFNSKKATTNNEILEYLKNIDKRLTKLENSQKKSSQAPTTKTSKKSEPKQKFETRAEAVEAWCKSKGISEADRKAYGEAKKAERELSKKAYEMTCSQFTEKVDYKVWKKAYNENLANLKK